MAYHRFHGLDTKIVRIFNTYGPRMRVNDGRAVPAFCSQALRNEDVTIFGDGSQTRSFTYITDLVDGIIRLMLSNVNDPVNIGNPRETTIEQIARTIIRMTGSKSRLVYRPLPDGRSEGPPARHHPRPHAPRLGTQGRPRRGTGQDDRVLPDEGRIGRAGQAGGRGRSGRRATGGQRYTLRMSPTSGAATCLTLSTRAWRGSAPTIYCTEIASLRAGSSRLPARRALRDC